ncbi:Prl7d1 [Lemmus lemmus]
MLLLSNLLLCEGVASALMNISDADLSEVSLKDLFENATILAENISDLATDLRLEFVSTSLTPTFCQKMLSLHQDRRLGDVLKNCHTLPIKIPNTKEEVRKTLFEEHLNMTLRILRDWKDPLKHLVTELSAMPGVPDDILSKAKAIEDQHKIFLEHILKIVPKVNPAIQENEGFPVWSFLESLKTNDERIRFFALYMFSLCLQLDLQIVEYYVRILKCLYINGDICYLQSRGTP